VIFKGACFKLGGIKRTQLKIKNMKIKWFLSLFFKWM
jgi:hypothetical protein